MEPAAAAHIQRRGLRFDSHQRSAARPEQPRVFHLVGREQDSRLRDRAEGLCQRPLAVLARLRLHRCTGVERHLGHHPQGNRIQLVPFHQFSWWNKYQIDPVWSASLGAVYFSDSYASSDDTVYLPGFLRFDAGVYAQIDATWKAQLNIENIFNKGYWATADGNNNISPGAPRNVQVTLATSF